VYYRTGFPMESGHFHGRFAVSDRDCGCTLAGESEVLRWIGFSADRGRAA